MSSCDGAVNGPVQTKEKTKPSLLGKGDDAAYAGLAADPAPRETADRNAFSKEQVDVPTEAFGVNDVLREEVDVHELVVVLREEIVQSLAVLALQETIGLSDRKSVV